MSGYIEWRDCRRACLLSELNPGSCFQLEIDGEQFYRGFDNGDVECFGFDRPRTSDFGDFSLNATTPVYEIWQEYCDEKGKNINDKDYPNTLPSPYLIN